MKKVLWVMNKYVDGEYEHAFYPYFLKYSQEELVKQGIELHFVHFSSLLKKNLLNENNHFFDEAGFNHLNNNDIEIEAARIEQEYSFTFKQAWFPDLIQVSKEQNTRKITVPEHEFNDTSPLVKKFIYLENLIRDQKFDILFSDVSPEVEMEFARAIGQKMNISVLKAYEGSFLGRTVILQSGKFGEYEFIEVESKNEFSQKDAEEFIFNYVHKDGKPFYLNWEKNTNKKTITERAASRLRQGFGEILTYPLGRLRESFFDLFLWFESTIMKRTLYKEFDPQGQALFFGFHLNRESTMGLRSMPYVNQTALVEMISRVLPYGYTLYVREHPHWPKTFPYKYLSIMKKLPNVRILSPKISIHNILKNAKGFLVYNSNTGHEALMYGKPVLSFASNLYYKNHPAALYSDNLYELGEKLVELVNLEVKNEDTVDYIKFLLNQSIDMGLGSNLFVSENDAKSKALEFSKYFSKCIAAGPK